MENPNPTRLPASVHAALTREAGQREPKNDPVLALLDERDHLEAILHAAVDQPDLRTGQEIRAAHAAGRLGETQAVSDAANDLSACEKRILATRATTWAGVIAKLRLATRENDQRGAQCQIDENLVRNALADLERLAGGMSRQAAPATTVSPELVALIAAYREAQVTFNTADEPAPGRKDTEAMMARAKYERAGDRLDEALKAVLAFPVVSSADTLAKVRLIDDLYHPHSHHWHQTREWLLSDLKRLAKGGAP
jgi:hypothetical protein